MSIVAARIDARLLHGIVATQWTPKYRPQRLMIIDDEFASDPTRKAGLRMAKPANVALSVITEQTALTNFAAGKYDDHTVFVVVRNPQIIAHLIASGQSVPQLVVGLVYPPAEDEEAIEITSRAYIRLQEFETYREIEASGTRLIAQYVPSDNEISLHSYIESK